MDPVFINILYVLVIALIPLVPAFLLFKFFKDYYDSDAHHADLDSQNFLGKLFNVKFSGPAALYLIVLAVMYYLLQPQLQATETTLSGWRIVGVLKDSQGSNLLSASRNKLTFVLKPQPSVTPNGVFRLALGDGQLEVADGQGLYESLVTDKTIGDFRVLASKKEIHVDTIRLSPVQQPLKASDTAHLSFDTP